MSLPRVTVTYADGNLVPELANLDGLAGLIISGTRTDALPLDTPVQINSLADAEALDILPTVVPPASATGSITIATIGTNGDEIKVVLEKDGQRQEISDPYEKIAGDTTPAAVAAKLAAAINTHTSDFSATAVGAVITVTSNIIFGDFFNGGTLETLIEGQPTDVGGLVDGGTYGSSNTHAHRQIREFYTELGGNQPLWVMLVANTLTMENVLAPSNADGAKKLLLAAQGNISLLGIVRVPDNSHLPGANFIDAEVAPALVAANNLGVAQLGVLQPIRILVGARVATAGSSNILQVKDLDLPFAGAVLGSSASDNVPAMGLALGRAVKFGAEIKVGKVANGPLSIPTGFIGATAVQQLSNLPSLHGAGFISLMTHPGKGGIYFGIDRMATTGDYRILAHGRVIDKACRITAATYANQLESEVDITAAGQISDTDLVALRTEIEQAITVGMGDQISGVECIINPAQNLINNPTLQVKLNVRPKGYTSFISVELGLVAGGS